MLSLDRRGVTIKAFAPDKPQMHVVDHRKTEPQEGQTRNVLEESSRITRGDIEPLSAFNADDVDALIFPGGFGRSKISATLRSKVPKCRWTQMLSL